MTQTDLCTASGTTAQPPPDSPSVAKVEATRQKVPLEATKRKTFQIPDFSTLPQELKGLLEGRLTARNLREPKKITLCLLGSSKGI